MPAELHHLPTFIDDDIFHVVIESPRGSGVKLKYSADLLAFTVSRPLPFGLTYPFDWGFVPSTRAEDGDPVDAAVLWDVSTFPGIVIPCRALAVVKIEQNSAQQSGRVRNDRVVAIPVDDRRRAYVRATPQLGQRLQDELNLFFTTAAALEGKDPRILGWDDGATAVSLLRNAAV